MVFINKRIKRLEMNSNIDYVLTQIKESIPPQILRETFKVPENYGVMPRTIDSILLDKIIHGVVLKDMNFLGGRTVTIDLTGCPTTTTLNGFIIDVGTTATQGKRIMSTLSVGYGNTSMRLGGAGIASALDGPMMVSDSRVTLIGPNVIFIEGNLIPMVTFLRCTLENEKMLNHIDTHYMEYYSELCVLATKRYIYNRMSIELGTATVIAGVDISKMINIIDTYSDADSIYKELRAKLPKISHMSDAAAYRRWLRIITPQ